MKSKDKLLFLILGCVKWIIKYTQNHMHFRPPILRNQQVVFALDKDSPLFLGNPSSLSKFAPGGVKVMDVAAEIRGGSDMFKAVHMSEENLKGNSAKVSVDRLKSMLHSVFTVPRYRSVMSPARPCLYS